MLIKCYATLDETKKYLLEGDVVFLFRPRRLAGSDHCAWLQRVRRKPHKVLIGNRFHLRTYEVEDALSYERQAELRRKAVAEWEKSTFNPRPPYPYMHISSYMISLDAMADALRNGKGYVSSYTYEVL